MALHHAWYQARRHGGCRGGGQLPPYDFRFVCVCVDNFDKFGGEIFEVGENCAGVPPPAQRLFQRWRSISGLMIQQWRGILPSLSKHPGAAPAWYTYASNIMCYIKVPFSDVIFPSMNNFTDKSLWPCFNILNFKKKKNLNTFNFSKANVQNKDVYS